MQFTLKQDESIVIGEGPSAAIVVNESTAKVRLDVQSPVPCDREEVRLAELWQCPQLEAKQRMKALRREKREAKLAKKPTDSV